MSPRERYLAGSRREAAAMLGPLAALLILLAGVAALVAILAMMLFGPTQRPANATPGRRLATGHHMHLLRSPAPPSPTSHTIFQREDAAID